MSRAQPHDETPPLKRHAALQPLSREHMGGLVQARNLQQATTGGYQAMRAAADDFVRVWREEIAHHFDDEERLLLPLTRDAGLRARLLDEHRILRELAACCSSDPAAFAADPAMLERLGTLLHDHIRWEERILFEAIQREAPDALESLRSDAAAIEYQRPGARARHSIDQSGTSPRRDS